MNTQKTMYSRSEIIAKWYRACLVIVLSPLLASSRLSREFAYAT